MKTPFLVLATSVALLATAAPALAELPTPISAATARTYLMSLTIEPENNVPPYSRSLFKHWDIISGKCDTRETVLKRDGTNVVTDSACAPVSGHWVSPYDGAVWDNRSDLDIDHLVPLREAWVSGARLWTNAQREAFANDLTRPQLVAVTDRVNQAKGDKDPAEWLPPLASYHCVYIRAWVQVKYVYGLTVDSAEKEKLDSLLADC